MYVYMYTQETAYMYVCGDAENMARDVHTSLRHILMMHSPSSFMTEAEAEAYLQELKQRQRYVLDIWT